MLMLPWWLNAGLSLPENSGAIHVEAAQLIISDGTRHCLGAHGIAPFLMALVEEVEDARQPFDNCMSSIWQQFKA